MKALNVATGSSRSNRLKLNGSTKSQPSHRRVRDFVDALSVPEMHFATYELLRRLVEQQPDEPFSVCHPDDPADFVAVVTPLGALEKSWSPLVPGDDPGFVVDEKDERPSFEQFLERFEAEFGQSR